MELFQVRYFLALARTLNFTRAAEACHVSQPALTRAIQRLEEELGGPLLHRERNLTQLTALGRAMLPYLEAAHAAAESAAAEAAAFQRRDCEPLRLGIETTLSAHILAPALRALQQRLPGFAFALTESASADLLERMMAGELDSALMVEPAKPPERLQRWRLFADRYVVLCPLGHPLAELHEIPIQALSKESLLGREQPSDIEQALDRLCAAAGVTPKPRHRCTSEDQLRQMVAAGLGIALSAEHGAPAVGIVARPLADPGARRDIVLAAIAGRQHGPALAAFLKLMRARDWRDPEVSKS
ncbi:MAG TPA: LysR family transcriptional regulator [Verrucomicrobiae bacterium]|jgi:DNA-binding transcriptional LysR family regulator|nr:LysR family transcriptional regulator [Verrucomicrobiae bacterium]